MKTIFNGKKKATKITAFGLMTFDDKLWDKLGVDSGSELRADKKKFAEYKNAVKTFLEKRGITSISEKVMKRLEDENRHTLNNVLDSLGMW